MSNARFFLQYKSQDGVTEKVHEFRTIMDKSDIANATELYALYSNPSFVPDLLFVDLSIDMVDHGEDGDLRIFATCLRDNSG